MLKMVDGTGIIGVDMICPLGVSTPQPPNYDRVEMEGTGILVLPNSLDAPLEGLELGGKTEQVQTTGAQLFDIDKFLELPSVEGGLGRRRELVIKLKPTTKYTMSSDIAGSTSGSGAVNRCLYFSQATDNDLLADTTCVFNNHSITQISDGEGHLKITLFDRSIAESIISRKNYVMLNEGSAAQPYEPYTGNKPSPSPEYPQEIKNVGKWNEETQKYEVVVKAIGKNLFDIEKAKNTQNWFTSVQSGYSDFEIYVGKGNTVTISYTDTLEAGLGFYAGIVYKKDGAVGAWLYNSTNISANTKKVTFTANEDYVYTRCSTNDISKFTDNIKMLQVEIGKTQTDFIQGKEQSITITSDRPITKWDRLVEQGGEIGWLYGTKKYTATGSENYFFGIEDYYSGISTNMYVLNARMGQEAVCDRLTRVRDIWFETCKDGLTINSGKQIHMRFFNSLLGVNDDATKEEKKAAYIAYLKKEYEKGTPYEIVYQSLEPEFIPLPQSEQNAIRALKTYYPTTVITADGGELDPDIKVTYRKEI